MIDKKTFKKAIATPLERAGFVKKGQSWYLNGQDTIIEFNLQKSDWDDMYYVNISISLKAIGEIDFPPKDQVHLSYRIERLFPNEQELIRDGCFLERGNIKSLTDLTEFIDTKVVPFLQKCTHENYLREVIRTEIFKHGYIRKDARLYLDVQ
jgi:hypothetical protein